MAKKSINPDVDSFNNKQKRSVIVALIIALIFGAYLLRPFFILISVSAIVSFMFLPFYKRLNKKFSSGSSSAITLVLALLMLVIPLILVISLTIAQLTDTINNASHWASTADFGKLGQKVLDFTNETLSKVPYGTYKVTESDVRNYLSDGAKGVAGWAVGSLSGLLGGIIGFITTSIIFIYVFISLLINHDRLSRLLKQLNPMGPEVTEMYLHKAGAMVHGTVGGQFIIAVIQGVTGAVSIYIAGFHEAFVVFCLLFTLLSMIPLGSGIITIPFGLGMMLFGNIAGGILIVLWHILGVTNIDNILRPILVPKTARLDPALMIVTVFAGIYMFGFWGIFIGPVIMILIVSTINIYLAVFKDVPLKQIAKEPSK